MNWKGFGRKLPWPNWDIIPPFLLFFLSLPIEQMNVCVDCVVTGYLLDGRGSVPGRGTRFFFLSHRPDRFWDPPSLLSNMYWGLFPRSRSGWGVKLIIYLHPMSRSRMVELHLHSPIRLRVMMLNWLSTGTTLPLPYLPNTRQVTQIVS
jgi:hypothetical protein